MSGTSSMEWSSKVSAHQNRFTRLLGIGIAVIATLSLADFAHAATDRSEAPQKVWSHRSPVEPSAGTWPALKFPDAAGYTLAKPPGNRSDVTRRELDELHELARNRSDSDLKSIHHWAEGTVSPNTQWFAVTELLVKKYKLTHPAAVRVHGLLAGTLHTTSVATFAAKYQHLRPRPTDLDPTLQLPEGFRIPAHPSYPSGHSAFAGAARTLLTGIFPGEAEVLNAMATEASLSRLKAGIHFRSDMEDGDKLGARIASDVLQMNAAVGNEATLRFVRVPNETGAH
jgi:hypothetical protein